MRTQDQLQHLDASAIDRLRAAIHGELVTPNDADYDHARRVWNAHIDTHPALITRCASESDVVRAVQFAREQDLRARCAAADTTWPATAPLMTAW